MPSPAFTTWRTDSSAALGQLEEIVLNDDERQTQQVRYAYVLLLCAHLQAYCGGLHTDATQVLVESIDPRIGAVLDANLSFARRLDRSNAQPATLATDFNRLDIELWSAVQAVDAASAARRRELEELNAWRNAIAHHDIEGRRHSLVPQEVTLAACRSWRSAVEGLAQAFDMIVADRLRALVGSQPW